MAGRRFRDEPEPEPVSGDEPEPVGERFAETFPSAEPFDATTFGDRFFAPEDDSSEDQDETEDNRQSLRNRMLQVGVPFLAILFIALVALTTGNGDEPDTENTAARDNVTTIVPDSTTSPQLPEAAPGTDPAGQAPPASEEIRAEPGDAASAPPPRGAGVSLPPQALASRAALATRAEYDRISVGMTLGEVRAIIGSDGTDTSSQSLRDSGAVAFTWDGEEPNSSVTAVFEADRLSSKSQFGL